MAAASAPARAGVSRRPRNRGQFRRPGIADPAPLLVDADQVRRAAKVLAAARQLKPSRDQRSAWVWRHIAALQADIARRLADQAAASPEPQISAGGNDQAGAQESIDD